MRLCVDESGNKVYIAASAANRCELEQKFGDPVEVKIDGALHGYDIENVYAEPAGQLTTGFMMIGALIGLLGGPIGVILGGLVGGVIGHMKDSEEKYKVTTFNESHIGGAYDAPNT